MANSKLDPGQIVRMVYDEDAEAYSVVLKATELAIELDAEDGDSVSVQSISKTLESGIHSVVGMKVACLYGSAESVMVSPDDEGESFYSLSLSELIPVSICAKRIKIEGNCKVVVQG